MSRVLLVDDDVFLLDMYAVKFKEAAYEVDAVRGGDLALNKLRAGEMYDVILLDLVMPAVTGFDLLAAIKKEKLGGDPICLVLSNQGEQEDMNKAKKAGANGFLIKAELIPSEVVAKVDAFIKKGST